MWTRDAGATGWEPLFMCTTAGGTWAFVALPDGCALLLDGERVTSGDASPESVARVLDEFLRVAQVRRPAAPAEPRLPPAADPDPGSHGSPGLP